MASRHFLIVGASRGIGAALVSHVPSPGDQVWGVARSQPPQPTDGVIRHWIAADLAQRESSTHIADVLGQTRLDVLIYNAGIWEEDAFESTYRFEAVPSDENERIMTVNLNSAIHVIQKLLPNLRQSSNAKIILVGSTSGLENIRGPEVAYSASKFGLRGVAHALRENTRPAAISVTILNFGSVDTSTPYEQALAVPISRGIPLPDIVALVKCLVNLSSAICPKEIDIPAMVDTHA